MGSGNIYTSDFFNRINSHGVKGCSDFGNEFFLYVYLRLMELRERSRLGGGLCIKSPSALELILALKVRAENDRFVLFKILYLVSFFLYSALYLMSFLAALIATPILVIYFFLSRGGKGRCKSDSLGKVFILRSEASLEKLQKEINLSSRCTVLIDDFRGVQLSGDSIYSFITPVTLLRIFATSMLFVLRDCFLTLYDGVRLGGGVCAFHFVVSRVLHISHKAIFEACFVEVVKCSPNACFYTGDKEDRFAILETRVAKKFQRELICYPHGLEYGFFLPNGVCGSRFYCYTAQSKKVLSSIYGVDKFIYCPEVVKDMYGLSGNKPSNGKEMRVCFFTEPRDPEVNYRIIEAIEAIGFQLFIKLHPLENKMDYKKKFSNIEFVDGLDDALGSFLCVSRKSTILLEAEAKGSVCVSILVDDKDRFYAENVFPSLFDDRILKAYSFSELRAILSKYLG